MLQETFWLEREQHCCRLTQVSLSEALICRGAASISVCCLEAVWCKHVFVYGASVSSHFSSPGQNSGPFMVACRGEQAWWQIVGPQTRLAVCRHLLEMEQGPGPSVGWLAMSQAGVCCQQVAVCKDADPGRLAKGSTLARPTYSPAGDSGYLDYFRYVNAKIMIIPSLKQPL